MSVCEHGDDKNLNAKSVVELLFVCRGGSICEHGKIRSQCKECGGGSFCEHGRHAQDAKSAEAVLFMSMGGFVLSAEAVLFVNTGEFALNAKIAEAVLFAKWETTLMQRMRRRFYKTLLSFISYIIMIRSYLIYFVIYSINVTMGHRVAKHFHLCGDHFLLAFVLIILHKIGSEE